MNFPVWIIFLFAFVYISISAQNKDYELGADVMMRTVTQGGYFNYSDPEAINVSVAVWGWVKYPGRYKVPSYITALDLLSYAGGPTDAANLEDLRIYRLNSDSTQSIVKFNYNDLVYESRLESKFRKIPKLEAGDILIIPGEPRLYFKDHFSIWMSIFSVLISLSILVLNIVRR